MKLRLLALLGCAAVWAFSQAPQPRPVAIVGARIVPVGAPVIPQGTLVFAHGKITALGPKASVPKGAEVIRGKGLSVYPGMLDADTTVGIAEVSGHAPGTMDVNELGDFNPQLISSKAVNPTGAILGTVRANGVTSVLVAMRGGRISAQASLVDLGIYTNDQMSLERRAALWINFPSQRGGRGGRGGNANGANSTAAQLQALSDYFDAARRYAPIADKTAFPQPAMAAMVPYVTGKLPVILSVDSAPDIRAAIKFGQAQHLHFILAGAHDAWQAIPDIKAAGCPVLYGPLTEEPSSDNDPYDAIYSTPAALAKAGIPFAIVTGAAADSRNLPYNAALAEAYGLAPGTALEAITIAPAKILGVDAQIGSLAVGKRANLMITSGDPLDPRTQIQSVYIDGHLMPPSKHKALYDQWMARPDGGQ